MLVGTLLLNYFEFGPVVQEEMPFKDTLSIALAALLVGRALPVVQEILFN